MQNAPLGSKQRGRLAGLAWGAFGLLASMLVGFVAGAATGVLAPPGLFAEDPELEAVPEATTRPRVFTFSGLSGGAAGNQTILVMGSDVPYVNGRPVLDGPARSDTLMVVRIDTGANRLSVLSIPRDTRCEIPGHGMDKVNSALALGGPELAVQTVSNLLGVPIDHWVKLKLDGLIRMVDLVGGVDLDVPQRMRYTDHAAGLRIRLDKGPQHLDGEKAHEFVRFRHDSQGDIGRISRQQLFVRSVARKLLSAQSLLVLPQLLQAFHENVETDLAGGQMAGLAIWGKGLTMDGIRLVTLPGEFSAGMKASYWLVDEKRVHRLADRVLLGKIHEVPGASISRIDVHVAILNGTRRPRLATEAARLLRADGWTVWAIGDADRTNYTISRLLAPSGDEKVGAGISRSLGITALLETGTELPAVPASREDIDYVVILGEDFLRALRVPMQLGG